MAVLLITHDLGIVAQTAQRIMVMYMGKIVEEANVHRLFAEPLHPYTRGLFHSLPNFHRDIFRKERLEEISGVVGSLVTPPPGCYFSPRCRHRREICQHKEPPLNEVQPGQSVRCWLVEKGGVH